MSSFISVKEHARQCKILRKENERLSAILDKQFGTPCEQVRHQEEIESLRSDLEKANERCSQWADIAGAHGAEKDKWKQLAMHLLDWVKHQHGIGTPMGLVEVYEIFLEEE